MAPLLERLPAQSVLELHVLLQWHAQSCLDSGLHPPEPRMRRLTRKQPMSTRRLIERVARDPLARLLPSPLSWEQRRDTAHYAAHVYAHHSGETVRASRAIVARLWEAAAAEAKANFYLISQRLGKPGPSAEAIAGRGGKADRPVFAGLFTWQTSHGRKRDAVGELRRMRLSAAEMAEELVSNRLLEDEFANFTAWAAAMCSQEGFDVWTACMELNSTESQANALHLHLFVALRWDKFKTPDWVPIAVRPSNWLWRGFTPHFKPTNLKANANPSRATFNGMYYNLAPKIGSIFRDGNREVWKDGAAACRARSTSLGRETLEPCTR